jgi:hypothetical protein
MTTTSSSSNIIIVWDIQNEPPTSFGTVNINLSPKPKPIKPTPSSHAVIDLTPNEYKHIPTYDLINA